MTNFRAGSVPDDAWAEFGGLKKTIKARSGLG
jgi:hypothetical protein